MDLYTCGVITPTAAKLAAIRTTRSTRARYSGMSRMARQIFFKMRPDSARDLLGVLRLSPRAAVLELIIRSLQPHVLA